MMESEGNASGSSGSVRSISLVALAIVSSAVDAQSVVGTRPEVAVVELVYQHEFGRVHSARELADGRVIVSDATDRELLVLATDGKTARRIGRQGPGPSEYSNPTKAFVAGRDSSLFVDAADGRWYMLAGENFATIPSSWTAMRLAARAAIAGVDARGLALALVGTSKELRGSRYVPTGWVGDADSVLVLLLRANGPIDTVARLAGGSLGRTMVEARRNGVVVSFRVRNPLSTYDQAMLFPDGFVATVSANPYRVAWRTPSGAWIRGPVVPDVAQPVDERIKLRAAAGYLRNDDGSAVLSSAQFPPWPKIVPPFLAEALHAGLDGKLYVTRTRLHPEDELIVDVFGRDGSREQTLRGPPGGRLVGVGARHVYVAREAIDGADALSRIRR